MKPIVKFGQRMAREAVGCWQPPRRYRLEMLVGDEWKPIASSAAPPQQFLSRPHSLPWRSVDSLTGRVTMGRQKRESAQ